jgi:predicted dinucleotide-binding enzyme
MMKIGILGSGRVGQTIAAKLAAIDQDVLLGTRSPEKIKDWSALNSKVKTGSLSLAAAHGEVVINATRGDGSLEALEAAGPANLSGKLLIDLSNPLDFSHGMPPSLTVCNTDSLGEQIQRLLPETKVVKSLNTMNMMLMVDPRSLADGDHTLFLSGDDPAAKAQAGRLLAEWFGWSDIFDLGNISTSRGAEALLLIWTTLMMKLGTPKFQFKIVR